MYQHGVWYQGVSACLKRRHINKGRRRLSFCFVYSPECSHLPSSPTRDDQVSSTPVLFQSARYMIDPAYQCSQKRRGGELSHAPVNIFLFP